MNGVINNLKKSHVTTTGAQLLSQSTNNTVNSIINENGENVEAGYEGPEVSPLITLPSTKSNIKSIISRSPTENHVISSVLKRVSILEGYIDKTKRRLKNALSVIKEKDSEIIKLKDKIKELEEGQTNKKPTVSSHKDYSELVEMTLSLQSRISTVENFLKTDPYYWFKTDLNSDDEHVCLCPPEKFEMPDRLDLLLQQINELNFEAGEIHVFQRTKQGAAFQSCDSVSLTFYANGMQLEYYNFRKYSDITTQAFIKDIMDGYFPSELQREYPRGVMFHVFDKRYEYFDEDKLRKNPIFKGLGCKLDNRTDEIPLKEAKPMNKEMSSDYNDNTFVRDKSHLFTSTFSPDSYTENIIELNKEIFKRRDFKEMLKRVKEYRLKNKNLNLPDEAGDYSHIYRQSKENSIFKDIKIKNGNVCNFRNSRNKSSKHICGNSPRIKHLNPGVKMTDSSVQLKIRSLNNKDMYILTMQVNEPIGKLRSFLPDDVKDCNIMHYKDGSNRIYLTDNKTTLKDYGIMTNSVLVLSRHP